jgi:hypothetical protein
MSRRNLKILMKFDFPAALEPIITWNRDTSRSIREKLLKFSI